MNKLPRRDTIVQLGRGKYRVTGSERQGAGFLVRAVRVGGRGKLGAEILFAPEEIAK